MENHQVRFFYQSRNVQMSLQPSLSRTFFRNANQVLAECDSQQPATLLTTDLKQSIVHPRRGSRIPRNYGGLRALWYRAYVVFTARLQRGVPRPGDRWLSIGRRLPRLQPCLDAISLAR